MTMTNDRPAKTLPVSLHGTVERITYQNEENGYVVVTIGTPDFDSYTAVGNMPVAKVGLDVAIEGEWKINPKYPRSGPQFNFRSYSVPEPTGRSGIVAFLSSLKGLGEAKAGKIFDHFGLDSLKVLAENPDFLMQVPGIGASLLSKIKEAYHDARGLQDLIMFLHSVDVSAGYAPRIYKEYGVEAVAIVFCKPKTITPMAYSMGTSV